MHKRYNENLKVNDEVTKDFYYNQLECLMPIVFHKWKFLVWEAYDSDKNWQSIYACFYEKNWKFYWWWYKTVSEFLMRKYWCFYAFWKEQYEKQAEKWIEYANLWWFWLYAPKKTYDSFLNEKSFYEQRWY